MGTDDDANKKRVEDLAAELFKEPARIIIDEKRRSMLKRQRDKQRGANAQGGGQLPTNEQSRGDFGTDWSELDNASTPPVGGGGLATRRADSWP